MAMDADEVIPRFSAFEREMQQLAARLRSLAGECATLRQERELLAGELERAQGLLDYQETIIERLRGDRGRK